MQTLPIEMELRKLGLKEKEVRVYLTGLELGPAPVQKIAQLAKITRPTAYEIIEKLEEKRLFAEIKERRKRLFVAQSPEKILGFLRMQKRELEEKEREFIRIIAVLADKYSKEKGVKVYKGKAGLKVLDEILSFTSSSEIFMISAGVIQKELKDREQIFQKIKSRLGKLEVRIICENVVRIESFLKSDWQQKTIALRGFDGALILCDKAIFISRKTKEGVLIENQLIINLLKSLFFTLWEFNPL